MNQYNFFVILHQQITEYLIAMDTHMLGKKTYSQELYELELLLDKYIPNKKLEELN